MVKTVRQHLALWVTTGILLALAACAGIGLTKPSGNTQAAIAVAVDIATGLAVQQGVNDPAVWKARAASFKAIAVTMQGYNSAGVASLATLAADLQPLIVKLGPADVLAANALLAALTPYLEQQVQTNPQAGALQATVALILQDVVNATAAYGV